MRLLIALAGGACVFLVVATATGHATSLRLRLPGHRSETLSREVWLRQAGVRVTPTQFRAVSVAAAIVVELACWGLAGSAVVGIVPAIAAGLWPRAYFGRRRAVRLSAVVESWPQGVRDLLSFLQTQRSIHNALLELIRSGPEPLREAFCDYPVLAKVGGTISALATVREQLADPVSDRMIELLMVAHELGQSLTLQVLRDQAVEVTEDLRTTADIRAAQREGVLVAHAAFGMPWLGLVLLCTVVPSYRAFYQTGGGLVAVVVAGVFSTLGLVFARRLAGDVGEPRVLGGAESDLSLPA